MCKAAGARPDPGVGDVTEDVPCGHRNADSMCPLRKPVQWERNQKSHSTQEHAEVHLDPPSPEFLKTEEKRLMKQL